jgi:hypothetical protein
MSVLPDIPEISIEEEANDVNDKVEMKIEEKTEAEPIEEEETPQEDIFEKPVAKPKKKKRILTEQQLDNLKKAREKSLAKRRALKEVKSIELEQKKLELQERKSAKIEKDMEQESRIRLAAKMKMDAEKAAHFSEERLAALMEKTLDNYIEKKKKMKPKPRETIPAYTGNMSPQQISASQGIYQTHQQNLHQQQMQQQQQIPDPYAGLNSRDKTMLNNMFGFQ